MRQDPQVVLVGEIRDPETAAIAVQAGLTGHLVLSTNPLRCFGWRLHSAYQYGDRAVYAGVEHPGGDGFAPGAADLSELRAAV